MPIKRAIGKYQKTRAIQLSFGLQIEQGFLDSAQRDRSIHRVLREGISFYVEGKRTGEYSSVVVGLVTIAVDQHDIARGQQCLFDHLVGCRSAIRDEKHAVRSKCACCLILSKFDVSRGLQQAVETTCSRGGLRKEEV